jgi:hypothetical protein
MKNLAEIPEAELAEHLKTRTVSQLAASIQQNWPKVYFGAKPYLEAMHQLHSDDAKYGADDARGIVLYFLSNATGWRGPIAKAVKAELKRRFGIK